MEKILHKIPFLRLTSALITGIVIGSLVEIPHTGLIISISLLTLVLFLINRKISYALSLFLGIGFHLLFILIGIELYERHNERPVFYRNGNFAATVLEAPQEKPNSYKSLIKITYNDDGVPKKTNESVIVYFEKTEKAKILVPGDNIVFRNTPDFVKNIGNPFEFDYKNYLARKKIYRQIYLRSDKWNPVRQKSTFSIQIAAEKTREKLLNIYRKQNLGYEQFQILSALTLGYKRDLDPDIRQVFSKSGTMHVLAVSGLHVGIIYLVLSFLLQILKTRKTGRILFVIIIVICLWGYAFITGLSPSVERAATMFSLLTMGESLKRQNNVYNSLAASAFILLVSNPNNLFDTGFQLSYAAVFGIIFLQPRIQNLFTPKNKIFRYFWILISVSVAAQITTFPLTTLYFNQFPTYFLFSNLFIIPVVTILIPLGFLLLLVTKVSFISQLISNFVNVIISLTYFILNQIEGLPKSELNVSVHNSEFIITLFLLLFVFLFIETRGRFYIKMLFTVVLILFTASLIYRINDITRKEIIVYNSPENNMIHLISGKQNYIISEHELRENGNEKLLVSNTVRRYRLNPPKYLSQNDVFKDSTLLENNGIIFFEGKIIHFNRERKNLPEKFIPDFILNPSNSEYFSNNHPEKTTLISNKRFIQNFNQSGTKIYNVSEMGAFIKNW